MMLLLQGQEKYSTATDIFHYLRAKVYPLPE